MLKRLLFFTPFLFIFLAALFYLKDGGSNVSEDNLRENVEEIQKLSLERIFSESLIEPGSLPQDKVRVIIATGDIIPGRTVNFQTIKFNNFNWPYEKTSQVLKDGDLTVANLEAPLLDNCPVTLEGMVFCGSPRHIEGLQFGGIDVVNLANNHAGDYGLRGIEETLEHLSNGGILATGVSGPVYKDVKGLIFAFLGYNDVGETAFGLSKADDKKICVEVEEAKSKSSVVITSFHWGEEYVSQPNKRQRELAHLAIDCGSDLIIGNHPHWIQPVEIYKEKVITYALGNFIFDQMWSQKTREGVIGRFIFYDRMLIDIKFLPVLIEEYGQPRLLTAEEKEAILSHMRDESFKLRGL